VFVNEPDPDMDDGLLNTIERSRHAPQPDAPSEREAPLATMRADECSCVDHGCCGISYAGCPVHDLPIGSDAAPQPAEATGGELPSDPDVHLPGCVLDREHTGACRCTHAKPPSAPPTAEPRGATVTHAEARKQLARVPNDGTRERMRAYIAQQAKRDRAHAELERRARELCAEATSVVQRGCLSRFPATEASLARAGDRVAELLGPGS
jgi:hypothetical protein